MREPRHRAHELPERDRVVAGRRGHDDRPVHRVARSSSTIVGTPCAPYAAAACSWSARTSSIVAGSAIARSTSVGSKPFAPMHLGVHLGHVRLDAVVEERVADGRVPAVELVVAVLAPDERADPHLAPAERPRPLPRVLLALDPVHLLEREEPPRDVEPDLVAHVADPDRRLVRVRAHRVEVELHGLGHRIDSCTALIRITCPAANNLRNVRPEETNMALRDRVGVRRTSARRSTTP